MAKASQDKSSVGKRIQQLVNRTIKRNVNGVSYFLTPNPPVGLSKHDIIHKRGPMQVFHYHALSDEVYKTPVLIVSPTTNRSYCLDMMPGVSLVEYLLKAGYDVFLLDWQPPRPEDKHLALQDFSQTFVAEAISAAKRASGEDEVTLIGYCMGGVLSTIYTASYDNESVRNLVCFTTPVDWSKMGMFSKTTDKKHFDVDRLVDSIGNIPPNLVLQGFMAVDPGSKPASQITLWRNMWDADWVENFRKYDRWANDMLPLSGEYFRETIKDLMWDNALYTGKLMVGGRSANPKNITVPFFHAQAKHDSLIPPDASRPLIDLVGSEDKTEMVLSGGHVSLVCGPNAVGRLWPQLDDWLSERSA